MEKPVFRVLVWDMNGDYTSPVTQKDFRTLKAAENFAKKWGMKEDGDYDPEILWNEAANKLLKEA